MDFHIYENVKRLGVAPHLGPPEYATDRRHIMPTARDPRWVLLVETGECSSLSRYREPDDEDIAASEKALLQAARAGWVAVMSHSAYESTVPELLMVRPLCNPKTSFEDAVQAFQRRLKDGQGGNVAE